MKTYIYKNRFILIFLASILFHAYWLSEIKIGIVPGPVDPFLKTMQGYSLYLSKFQDQSIFYQFREIDPQFEFCFFQKDIFTFRLGNSLLGPFPIALTSIVGFLFYFLPFQFIHLFFFFVYLILSYYIFKSVKPRVVVSLLIFFALPFFIPNSEVSEHSFLIFLQLFSFSLLKKSLSLQGRIQKNQFIYTFFSGFSLGLGLFFRHEVLLFGNFMICSLLIGYFLQNYLNSNIYFRFRSGIFFCVGLYFAFVLFFLMNKYMYGSSVGPRLNTNSSGIYTDIFNKISFYKVMLWRDGSKFGLFGHNTIFMVTVVLGLFLIKKWRLFDFFILLPIFAMCIFIPIFAPNDGGSPWGARYLFLCIVPLVYMSSRTMDWTKNWMNGKGLYLLQILFFISILQTISHERRSLINARDVSKQQLNYKIETSHKDADLIVFTSELVAMQTGSNYFEYPSILISRSSLFPSFEQKFLKDTRRFKNITLVVPVTDHINLDKIDPTDLSGLIPKEIISSMDKRLVLKKIEKRTLVSLYWYENR